jgi:hypothetical protein
MEKDKVWRVFSKFRIMVWQSKVLFLVPDLSQGFFPLISPGCLCKIRQGEWRPGNGSAGRIEEAVEVGCERNPR